MATITAQSTIQTGEPPRIPPLVKKVRGSITKMITLQLTAAPSRKRLYFIDR